MTSDTLAKMSRNSVGIETSQRPDANHWPRLTAFAPLFFQL